MDPFVAMRAFMFLTTHAICACANENAYPPLPLAVAARARSGQRRATNQQNEKNNVTNEEIFLHIQLFKIL